uniref:Orf1 n=1 Tax=Moniliophthora roreri (strain MCA 2997) TaxID=1381753 RepID=F2WVN2_MONRO|nr:orf1 [Moniliophthora roreri]
MKDLNLIIELLKSFGIEVNSSNENIVMYAVCVFAFSVLILLSVVNLLIYFSILLGLENENIKSKLNEWMNLKYGWVLAKIINLYKKSRLIFIFFEIGIFFFNISMLLWSSYKIITGFI